MQLLICALVCLGSTLLGAVSGIGGGVIIKPALDAMLSLATSAISVISACAVLAMSLFSLGKHYLGKSDGELRLSIAGPLSIGSLIGGVAGKLIFQSFKGDSAVRALQNTLLFVLLLVILIFAFLPQAKGACLKPWTEAPVGLLMGLLSAFLGVGGGPFNMFALTRLYGIDYKSAALYSLMMIAFSQSASVITAALGGSFNAEWPWIVCACVAGVLGGVLGRRLQKHMNAKQCRALYIGILILILALCAYNIFS
ncbi:MAG: sulfite exporter TauE/SafE family protein [Eubacteriales bacterium]|nr:sulfite exporter TauE/SafE family protein [Eubacteriales bacterium]